MTRPNDCIAISQADYIIRAGLIESLTYQLMTPFYLFVVFYGGRNYRGIDFCQNFRLNRPHLFFFGRCRVVISE